MRPLFTALMMSVAIGVSGCNPTTVGLVATPLFSPKEQVNLLNASYAAAEQLSLQTQQRFPKTNSLRVVTLEELVDGGRHRPDGTVVTNPKLGAVLSDQLESRFIQLGYHVVPADSAAKGQIVGVYQAVGNQLAVRLRLKDTKTGAMLGQYDYWLPITATIRRHMDPYSGGIPLYKVREGFGQLID